MKAPEMFKKITLPLFALLVVFLVLPPISAVAAEITAHRDDFLNCIVKISGPLETGDAVKLSAFMDRLVASGEYDGLTASEYSYSRSNARFYNEKRYRICLDSQGGSFTEALKIADYVSQALGTAIPRGAQCFSACAIIFMAGSWNTESDEGVRVDRYLHAGGELGFHAPSLQVGQGDYTEDEVNKSYKIAVAAIGEIMSRSGDFRIARNLLSRMLTTPPDEMFVISSVFDAARWLIPVIGTVRPDRINGFSVNHGCANAAFASEEFSYPHFGYVPKPEFMQGGEILKLEKSGLKYEAEQDTYGAEGSENCRFIVDLAQPDLGREEFGYVSFNGSLSDSLLWPFMLFDPKTQLTDIARPDDYSLSLVPVRETKVEIADTITGICRVVASKKVRDTDPCTQETVTEINSRLKRKMISRFNWPSGAVTTMVTDDDGTTLNGATAQWQFEQAYIDYGTCHLNSASGNVFCFQEN